MFRDNRDDEKMHLSYDAAELNYKFSTGVVRQKFDSLLRNKSFEEYFNEKLCIPCKRATEALPEGPAKELMRETTTIMNLWFNLRINLMQNAVKKAFVTWLRFGRDIDEELESTLTLDFAKQMIDIFANATLTMIEKSEEIFEQMAAEKQHHDDGSKQKEPKKVDKNKNGYLN